MRTYDEYKRMTEQRLNELFPAPSAEFAQGEAPALLLDAMRYSLMAGGKRLRPVMLLAACELTGGDAAAALDFACALEMIHTYSLIHDDLPGMDDDTLRRGKPTNHVVYGVGQAILAGDGLLTYAFEVMLKAAQRYPEKAHLCLSAMSDIAREAGVTGMVAGQCADLYCEKERITDDKLLSYIHAGKTMAMFRGAVTAGARLAGAAASELDALEKYARAFGILFQVTDDILDVTAEADAFGKTKGKDAAQCKLTAVSAYSLEGAQLKALELKNEALSALEGFGSDADFFRTLVTDMYERNH
ncbi:MAG: polyprenyl synthetase family protein [Clostridia bacterium]|nr:polyprenyl synthetase family protein [Clostridia bacterium]